MLDSLANFYTSRNIRKACGACSRFASLVISASSKVAGTVFRALIFSPLVLQTFLTLIICFIVVLLFRIDFTNSLRKKAALVDFDLGKIVTLLNKVTLIGIFTLFTPLGDVNYSVFNPLIEFLFFLVYFFHSSQ